MPSSLRLEGQVVGEGPGREIIAVGSLLVAEVDHQELFRAGLEQVGQRDQLAPGQHLVSEGEAILIRQFDAQLARFEDRGLENLGQPFVEPVRNRGLGRRVDEVGQVGVKRFVI